MKLIIVESGEYSDFSYTPLMLSDDFDEKKALREFIAEVKRRYPDDYKTGYKVHMSLAGFLTEKYGARDVEEGELTVMVDPILYGNLDET